MEDRNANVNLFLRDDTFTGTCQAIGEDFGFNPNWLRVAFGIAVLFSFTYAAAVYLALAAVVLVSRVLAPRKLAKPVVEAEAAVLPAADHDQGEMRIAA